MIELHGSHFRSFLSLFSFASSPFALCLIRFSVSSLLYIFSLAS